MAEMYTTRQVIALNEEYNQYIEEYYDPEQKLSLLGDNDGLHMSFEHWLLKREADNIPKPDCRDNGNSGRKSVRKLDRVKSIGKTYLNIKGELITITKFLPGTCRFKDDRGRMYTPTGFANIGAMRLPRDCNLIIND